MTTLNSTIDEVVAELKRYRAEIIELRKKQGDFSEPLCLDDQIEKLQALKVSETQGMSFDDEKAIKSFMKAFGVDRTRAEELFRDANKPYIEPQAEEPAEEWEEIWSSMGTHVKINDKYNKIEKTGEDEVFFEDSWWSTETLVRGGATFHKRKKPSQVSVIDAIMDEVDDIFTKQDAVIISNILKKHLGQPPVAEVG
jgi:hypothetical protein